MTEEHIENSLLEMVRYGYFSVVEGYWQAFHVNP